MFIGTTITMSGAPAERNKPGRHPAPPERERSSARNVYFVPLGRNLTRFGWNGIAQLSAVLLCGGALKYFYSTASVNQLRWILAPTTLLVELVSGARFQFESHAGYMSSDHTFLIAASCAGVNFLLTAFLMLALGQLWRNRSREISWKFIPFAALLAYVATLIANTVRISSALKLGKLPREVGWLSPDQLHRFEGIFIYFGFLVLLFVVNERMIAYRPGNRLGRPACSNSFGLFWSLLFPLMIYYATALGIPLANGAYRQGADFWEHSLFVLLIPLIVVLPLLLFHVLKKRSAPARAWIRQWRPEAEARVSGLLANGVNGRTNFGQGRSPGIARGRDK